MRGLQLNSKDGILSDLTIVDVYQYYDRPILFSAIDTEKIIYIVSWYDEKENGDEKWIYSPISGETLRKLRSGDTDFHAAFLDSTYKFAFDVDLRWSEKDSNISIILKTDIDTNILPDAGQRLSESEIAELKSDSKIERLQSKKSNIAEYDYTFKDNNLKIINVPVFIFEDVPKIGNITNALMLNYFESNPDITDLAQVNWVEIERYKSADFETRFSGRKTRSGSWSLKSINQSSERLINGLRILCESEESIDDISIPYLKAGSLVYGVTSRSAEQLLGEEKVEIYTALKDIKIIADWISEGGNKPDMEEVRISNVLRAIEAMSPHERDDFNEVEIIPKSNSLSYGVKSFNLNYRSRISASERLTLLHLKEQESRVIKFRGNISKIVKPTKKRKFGTIYISDLSLKPEDWDGNFVSVSYDISKLLDTLLAFSGNLAEVSVAQRLRSGVWESRNLRLIAIKSVETEV